MFSAHSWINMTSRSSRSIIMILTCIFFILLTITLTKPSAYKDVGVYRIGRALSLDHVIGRQFDNRPAKVVEAFDAWHSCLSEALAPVMNDSQKLWNEFRDSVNRCYASSPMKGINLTGASNKDEFKFHIFNKTDQTPSVVITLGVGWDVLAEKRLKAMLPNGSRFYGADPIYEQNDKLYSEVGQFFPLAVGNETKVSRAFVMPKELGGNYEFRTMVHIDVITFLTKLTRTPFIDQFLMDNEGPEYDLLPMMGVGREFDQNGIIVCQINTEIHHGHKDYQNRFAAVFRQLLSDRRYAIFKVVTTSHHRTFLLNFEHQQCIDKYILQFFR
ncbi:hypothetical protein GCK32_004204 [Trichostrongylus colubriformis]|uniref:Methyltransferase FkbM domain-containing protein n=1 Tax=Trichostrongylus colubriformis TaxID=6319 RepID=A0AAN8IK47_TRICO